MVDAREIAEKLDIYPVFKATRTRRKKTQYGETKDEIISQVHRKISELNISKSYLIVLLLASMKDSNNLKLTISVLWKFYKLLR